MKKLIVDTFLIFFFTLISMLACSVVWANNSFTELPEQWQFYQTDNNSLYYDEVKQTQWQKVDVTETLKTNPKNGTYGWYSVNFDFESLPTKDLSLFMSGIRHADETWLNGQKIGGLGMIVKPWQLATHNPKNLPRHYHITPKLLKKKNNILAIKVNLGFGTTWGAMQPGGVGINGKLIFIANKAEVDEHYHKEILQDVVFDTGLIILGLVNVFIIIFLFRRSIHNVREFWWLLIDSIVTLGSIYLLDMSNVFQVSSPYESYLMMLSIFLTPLMISMYFWSVHLNIAKKQVTIIFCLVVLCSICMLLPIFSEYQKNVLWIIWCLFHVFLISYCLLSAIMGVKNKLIGSKVQLVGIIIFILSIRTQWMPTDFLVHRNIVVGSLIMRYALLLSYFQRINQMSHDYKNLSQQLLSTIEHHKQNIARDLHDDLGQRLSAIKLRMLLLSGDTKQESINFMKSEIDVTMVALRELIQGLHPFALEQHSFSNALELECQHISKLYNVEISLESNEIELSQEYKKHLFRIAQETLINAIKHGEAQNIHIHLIAKKNKLVFSIIDDGIGFDVNNAKSSGGGFGLVSVKERVAILNGEISFISSSNEGCKITIFIPMY